MRVGEKGARQISLPSSSCSPTASPLSYHNLPHRGGGGGGGGGRAREAQDRAESLPLRDSAVTSQGRSRYAGTWWSWTGRACTTAARTPRGCGKEAEEMPDRRPGPCTERVQRGGGRGEPRPGPHCLGPGRPGRPARPWYTSSMRRRRHCLVWMGRRLAAGAGRRRGRLLQRTDGSRWSPAGPRGPQSGPARAALSQGRHARP